MSARIIDGKAIAAQYKQEFAIRVQSLKDRGGMWGLAVALVADNPASQVYVRNKALASGAIGTPSEVPGLSSDTPQSQLIAFVRSLNANPTLHGILVQLPLPRHIDSRAVIEAIIPEKDVDGFHYFNVGGLVVGEPAVYPCTPWGVMKMLDHEGIGVEGKHAVVVGRTTIVGKPMAMRLITAA